MARRLAAILAADVVGYSRLMGEDEEGTLAAVRTNREDMVMPKVEFYRGHIIKLMGDGILVEFPSVVDAVACATAIQNDLAAAENQRIKLRIGINLGDVIAEDGDIFGDGVNVAARLESLAEPGGLCVSDLVYQTIQSKLDAEFQDMGEQTLKNIDRPVRSWQWRSKGSNSEAQSPTYPTVPADRPSIAVMQFANLSGDPEQAYFAEGIADDLISALSRFRWLLVISRSSAFGFEPASSDVRDVAEQLGVQYVLQGSIRRGGNRIRVAVRLVDSNSGQHLWAENYERDLEDIFAVQDEITASIVSRIAPEISEVERRRTQKRRPESLDAWGLYQQATTYFLEFTPRGRARALAMLEKAFVSDLEFAPAYALAGQALENAYFYGDELAYADPLHQALEWTQKAVQLDPRDAFCHSALGRVRARRREYGSAIEALETAITLNPNLADAYFNLGLAQYYAGQQSKAQASFLTTVRLDPRSPSIWSSHHLLARCKLDERRYAEAFESARRATNNSNASVIAYAALAAAAAMLGRSNEADVALTEAKRRDSRLSLRFVEQHYGSDETQEGARSFRRSVAQGWSARRMKHAGLGQASAPL